MKTVFIINPKAGKPKNIDRIIENIRNEAGRLKADIEIYITKSVGDACRFTKVYCEKIGAARFVACGGDGTLSEVLGGAIDFPEAEIGVMPLGTGNDFCRNFDESKAFGDVVFQLCAPAVRCDAIRYITTVGGMKKSGYCVNMLNIGFDCNVADMTNEIKRGKIIKGTIAYIVAIFVALIRKKGANLKIEIDGKIKHNGKLLLTSVANGAYCGGGIKSNPLASICDGFLSVNIVKNISRLKFLGLLPRYAKGDFLKIRGIEKVIHSEKCRKMTITPLNGNIRLCCDGEIMDAGFTEFEIVPDAFNFVAVSGDRNVKKIKLRQREMI
ncbi:MAG: diacylglycerol kinase family lipid kinase [Clostridia bacterium]|nr:diacylglycerol kinase family lipid kinase [Clostridia bacterium]